MRFVKCVYGLRSPDKLDNFGINPATNELRKLILLTYLDVTIHHDLGGSPSVICVVSSAIIIESVKLVCLRLCATTIPELTVCSTVRVCIN